MPTQWSIITQVFYCSKRDSYETPGDNVTEGLSHTAGAFTKPDRDIPSGQAAGATAEEIQRVFTRSDFVPK